MPGHERRPAVGGYRSVQVAGDDLTHHADADATHTIGCQQPITTEPPSTGSDADDTADSHGQPKCGQCVVEWMAATGQIRLVQRLPTFLGHLSEHPLLRSILLTRLARDTNARVWVVMQP